MEKDWIREGILNTRAPQQVGGTCSVHSVVASLQACLEIGGRFRIIPSAQDPINCCCDPLGTIDGGHVSDTLRLIKERGIAIEAEYELESERGACKRCGEEGIEPQVESRVFINDFVERYKPHITIPWLKGAVDAQPVIVNFCVGPEFHNHGKLRNGGVLDRGIYLSENPSLGIEGHSCVVVGYGTVGRVPCWKLRNSSGPDWGVDGCILVARKFTRCFYGAFYPVGVHTNVPLDQDV